MAKKTKNQMAYDLINQKYGLGGNQKYASSATTVTNNNKGNQSDKGSQNNKGKQSNSASSTTTNKSVETKPQSSFERINQKYGLSGTSTPTKKLSDFNTETKNAYTSVKNKLNTKTTIKSNLTDEERKTRISEIETEMRQLRTKLNGIGRAAAYGSTASLKSMKDETNKRLAELSEELKTLQRVGTFTASEMKQFEIDDAKKKKAALPNYNPTARVAPSGVEAYKKNASAHYQADKEIEELERQKELYDDVSKFGSVVNEDTFGGQWRANYRSNELSREADKAMSEYIRNPTEENKQIAYAYAAFAEEYAKNNAEALDDENVIASWLTKSAAGYLPQLKDQIVPELVGGGIGMLLGTAVGAPNVGASIGAGLGTYSQSYDVMRGSVYRTLLAEGVDEETALKAASDEAFISSLIESGETALSWLVTGGATAMKAIGNAAMSAVAKGSTNTATKVVANMATKATTKAATNAAKKAAAEATRPLWNKALRVAGGIVGNALTEYGEEFTQGAVSMANREKALASVEKEIGQYGRGNIDLYNRPIYKNADGSISTVDSVTFQIDDKFVVLPTIVRDEKGYVKRLNTDEEILEHYARTGEYLGEFDTLEESNAYANKLHSAQSYYYSGNEIVSPDDNLLSGGAKVIGSALSGNNPEAFDELHEQGKEGFKIGLMFGTGQTVLNNTVSHAATRLADNKETSNISPYLEKVEEKSKKGETIFAEEAQQASGYGENGSKILAEAVNNATDKTFSEVKSEMHKAYMDGWRNKNISLSTDFEREAYYAGKKDRAMQDLSAKEKAKNATVYESGVTQNKNFKKLSKASQELLTTIAKDHKMSVEMREVVAAIVNGKITAEANALHQDGKLVGSLTAEQPVVRWALHEDGHRMEQMATEDWNVLANALYERAVRLGRATQKGASQGSRFDEIKSQHDNAGLTLNTRGYFGEVVMRELETIFGSEKEFNAWRAELDGNVQAKNGWQKFMEVLSEIIADIKRTLSRAVMSKEARAEADRNLAELERIKELYAKAYLATRDAVAGTNNAETSENNAGSKNESAVDTLSTQNEKSFKTYRMNSVLGDSERSLGVSDGQAYVTNGKNILPSPANRSVFLAVDDAEAAKAEFGANEADKTSANISKILNQSDFTPIRANYVDGTLEGVGEVRVYTDENGREIALEKNVAEYFEGYNLEATFRGGKPYAIKATDNDGNVVGVAMAVWMNESGQKYNITDARAVSTKGTATGKTDKSGIQKGDVFTAKKTGTEYKIVYRDDKNTTVEISSTEGTKTMVISNEIADSNFSNMSEEGITKWIDEDLHIDNRSWEDVSDRKVKAFQFLFPEFQGYYTPLAMELLGDLQHTIKGERIQTGTYETGTEWTGISRLTSDAIARIKDTTNATYDDIRNALERLINDEGQENIALAKKIEIVFDEMLTDGYNTFDGMHIPPNDEYVAKKEELLGKTVDAKESEINSDDDWSWMFDTNFSLKNKNLTINSRIHYVELKNFIGVTKGDNSALNKLVTRVKQIKKGTYKNDATGYSADINADTIRKAIHPTHKKFDAFKDEHIRNLNAMVKLPELFKNAVYVDSMLPQKGKNQNPSFKEYHHFVAPVFMNNGEYRALITAREKVNSNTLYVLKVEVLPTKKRHTLSATQQKNAVGSQSLSVPSDISIPELVNGVKIFNYDTNTDNTYTSADIQFSLKDSEGNTLTKAQQEYFKDSKIRDENGNLLVVYHGSPAKFTVFDHKYLNVNGNSHGRGFYFTEKRSLAEGYERESGQLLKGYLNITNPLSEDKVTIKKADLLKLIKAVCKEEAQEYVNDGEYDSVSEAIRDTWISNYVNTYETRMDDAYREVANSIYSANTNDVEMIAELTNAGRNDIVLKLTHDILGYDGVIYTAVDGSHEFVSLVSEQFKSIDNTKPTSDPDIRFSLKDSEYLELAKDPKKNDAKLRKMVDEVAKEAGYIGTYYHGSKSDFTVFKKEFGGGSNSNAGIGFWFTETEEGAKNWADESWWGNNEESKVYKTYLHLNNPKVYETVDTKAQREELKKGYESIDKEMTLYDSIYFFDDGRRYHTERYDYDKSKRRSASHTEWEAFKAIVKKYDADHIDYYMEKIPEGERQIVKQDAERYLELSKERKALEKQITELRYYDAYELFRTDMYKQIGLGAEDANIGGTGKYVENKDEMLKKYVDMLQQEGYDGIIIKNTDYDTRFFGEHNNQYLVFDSNQVKSAETVTYDDNGNIIPLSERFNKSNDDIRYSLKDSEGKTLTESQQEYFKNSKIRDKDGNLLVMYHGTTRGGFTVFDGGKDYWYFTNDKKYSYAFEGRKKNGQFYPYTKERMEKGEVVPQRYKVYLNVTNPYIADIDTVEDALYWDRSLASLLREKGYDALMVEDMSQVIVLNANQIKNTTNKNPSASDDIRHSLKEGPTSKRFDKLLNTVEDVETGKKGAKERLYKYVESGVVPTEVYDNLVKQYGAIRTGEKPHREVQVPQKTAQNKKVSQTVRTILEAEATPDEFVPTIEKMVEDGVFSYDVYTDKQAIADSEKYIKEYGWDESLDDWFDAVNKGEVSKELTTMGWALYNNAANIAATTTSETERTSAIKTSLKILDAMVRHQRSAAQALQATRILKTLSPETQLYAVQKSVHALQNELTEKYGKKAPDLQIDEQLAEQFINAKTDEERAEIEKEIYKDIGRQMPSRFIDKWNAWRYLAMLGNPRTHIRNVVGNAGFAPVVIAKDLTATAIESVVHRVSGKKTVRGKSIIVGNKTDRALLKAAWSDYSNVADLISNGGKYNDAAMANQHIEEGRRIFRFKPLEMARKGNSRLLEMEDTWFSKPHYAYALAQYCKANNITPEQISRGKAIAPARDYAIKEAQKATYRDTNAFSQMVSEWGRRGNNNNAVKKVVSTVIEGILPFRKTPANILVRGVEYSPLGLLKGLSYDLVQVSKGKMSATEAIDNISAGLTGTGLLALGVYLAAQGLIRGHGEDDKDEKEFNELMGHQAYSLELPNGQSITLDWLAPEALPLFVGVNIWEATKGSDKEVNFSTILKSVSNISEPMLEMSCLQGLNDLFEGVGYASSNDMSGLVSVLSSAVTSYLMQGIPTIFGQFERTFEAEREGQAGRMTTYTEKNAFLTGDMQYTLGKASAKIPFWDYNQIPYIDAWGRKEASGSALKRGLNNFLNPAYTSTIESSYMEKELLRLYESTGETSVFPSRADKYFTVDNVRKDLTADEYVRYATLKGEKSYKLVTELVNSSAYKKLDDEEKRKAIEEAYDYANQKAKDAISNFKPDKWVSKADEFSNVGNFLSFRAEYNTTKKENGDKITKQEVADIILNMAQSDPEMWQMYLAVNDSKGDLYAYEKGVDGGDYMNFLNTLEEVDKPNESGKLGTYTQDEATKAIKKLKGLSRKEKAALWQSVNTNWKASNNPFR